MSSIESLTMHLSMSSYGQHDADFSKVDVYYLFMTSLNYLLIFYHYLLLHLFLTVMPSFSVILTLMQNTFLKDFIYYLISEAILRFFKIICVSYVKEWKMLEFHFEEEFIFQSFLLYHFRIKFHILLNPHKLLVVDHFHRVGRFFQTLPNVHQSMLFFPLVLPLFLIIFLMELISLFFLLTFVDFLLQLSI